MNIETDAIWKQVQDNFKALDACDHHEFVDDAPEKKFDKKWRCARCGGTVDGIRKMFYEKGYKHGLEAGRRIEYADNQE